MLMHDAHRLLIYPSIYGLFDTALLRYIRTMPDNVRMRQTRIGGKQINRMLDDGLSEFRLNGVCIFSGCGDGLDRLCQHGKQVFTLFPAEAGIGH